MANPHKGEVGFESGGVSYTLSYSANAWCEIEEEFGQPPEDVFNGVLKGEMKLADMRRLFWQGLLDHHPGTSLEGAKKILKGVQSTDMGRLMGLAILRAMPEVPAGAANPPVPAGQKDGTAPAS